VVKVLESDTKGIQMISPLYHKKVVCLH